MTRSIGALAGSLSVKQLGVLLLPLEWDASPSQSCPQWHLAGNHLYTWVNRNNVEQSFSCRRLRDYLRDVNFFVNNIIVETLICT